MEEATASLREEYLVKWGKCGYLSPLTLGLKPDSLTCWLSFCLYMKWDNDINLARLLWIADNEWTVPANSVGLENMEVKLLAALGVLL